MRLPFPAIGLCLWLCSCGNAPPSFDETTCPFKLDKSQVPGQTVRCGNLDVPEERARHNSARIKVPVLVFKSQAPQAPPMVNLAGGPGQSWADLGLDSITTMTNALLKRDLIFIEQRGTGLSVPNLACPELDATSMDNMKTQKDPLLACRDRLIGSGVELGAYNTRALAADVEDMRGVLGYPDLIVNGTSYGTAWGLEIMREFPGSLHSVVLDSVLAPQDPPVRFGASGRDRALTALFSACQKDPMCQGTFPDLETKLTGTISALEKTPIGWAVAPMGVLSADVFVSTVDEVQFAQPGLLPFFIETVSDAITAGRTTLDPADPRIEALLMSTMSATSHLAVGQYLSIDCADNQLVTEADVQADLAKVRPVLRPYLQAESDGELQVCQEWPFRREDLNVFTPVTSSVPTLVLSGALDPRTPPAWAMDAEQTLSRGMLLLFPGLSHSVQSADSMQAQTCLDTVLRAFIGQDALGDTSCVAQVAPSWVLK